MIEQNHILYSAVTQITLLMVHAGVCLTDDQKAWKVCRVFARTKNKANHATCKNVTTLYEEGLPPPWENCEKSTLNVKTTCSEAFGTTKGGYRGPGGGWVIGFSRQICTNLKNGSVELQKAWKPEKPEKGWPLCMACRSVSPAGLSSSTLWQAMHFDTWVVSFEELH